ncbi:MAG TPA: hypothetical protein DIU11_03205 [Pusillimonas sp.]|nr:hypothetical protein [Pusillimonas sp.]
MAPAPLARAIQAPWGTDAALLQTIRKLREAGEIVVQVLPGQLHSLDEFNIDRELVLLNGQWQIEAVA